MKLFSKALILMLFFVVFAGASQVAKASGDNGYKVQAAVKNSQDFQKLQKRWQRRWERRCQRARFSNHPRCQARAVPELNAAGAPLALLLIGGLIALGVESRRRKGQQLVGLAN